MFYIVRINYFCFKKLKKKSKYAYQNIGSKKRIQTLKSLNPDPANLLKKKLSFETLTV